MSTLSFAVSSGVETLDSLDLPVEVRRSNSALVSHRLISQPVELEPGTYYVFAKLPTGQQLSGRVQVPGNGDVRVVLVPDYTTTSPTAASVRTRKDQAVHVAVVRWFRGNVLQNTCVADERRALVVLADEVDLPAYRNDLEAVQWMQLDQPGEPPINMPLPTARDSTVRIRITTDADGRRHMSARLDNPTADLLLQYMEAGYLQQAHLMTAAPALNAEELLRNKRLDPVAATAAAYALLRLGALDRLHDWTDNLRRWFPWLPDGVVIRAEHLARLGEHSGALAVLLDLSSRGLPIFSDGLAYAINRLRLYIRADEGQFEHRNVVQARHLLEQLQRFARFVDSEQSIVRFTGRDPNTPNTEVGTFQLPPALEVAAARLDQPYVQIPNSDDIERAVAYLTDGVLNYEAGAYQEALLAYTEALKLIPFAALFYVNSGLAHQALKAYDEALEDYAHAISLDPSLADAYHNRGTALQELGLYNDALKDFDQAIRLNPKYTRAYANRAYVNEQLGRYREALTDYSQANVLSPADAKILFGRGVVHILLEEYENALEDFTRSIAADPDYAPAYVNRGAIYLWRNLYETAIADFTQALEQNTSLVEAYFNRAVAFDAMHRYEEALNDLNQVMQLRDSYAPAYDKRGIVYYRLQRMEDALRDFSRAMEIDERDPLPYYNRGNAHEYLGRYIEALGDYTEAIRRDPALAPAFDNRGGIYARLGQFENALEDYSEAIRIDPLFAHAISNRGAIYALMQRYEAALGDFDRAIEIDPRDARMFSNRGATYYRLGRYEQALAEFERARALEPTNAEYRVNCGIASGTLEHYEQALTQFDAAIELNPHLVAAFGNRAATYEAMGRHDQAIRDYAQVLVLEPFLDRANSTFYGNLVALLRSRLGEFEEPATAAEDAAERSHAPLRRQAPTVYELPITNTRSEMLVARPGQRDGLLIAA